MYTLKSIDLWNSSSNLFLLKNLNFIDELHEFWIYKNYILFLQ